MMKESSENLKHMRTTWGLLGLLLVAGGIYLWRYYGQEGATYGSAANFAIADTSQISRVVLTRMVHGEAKQQIDLTRGADQAWTVNYQYPAFKPRVTRMLAVMHLMQVRERLTEQGQHSAQSILATQHIQLDAFDQEELVRSYMIGTQTSDAKGTVMKLRQVDEAFVMELPGFQGYLNAYFPLELNFWRENRLAIIDAAQLASFEITYADSTKQPLRFQQDATGLLPVFEEADTAKVKAYVSQFEGALYAETFATGAFPGQLPALKEKAPDVQIAINYLHAPPSIIHLYTRPDNPNNYFAWIAGDSELLTVQHFVIDPFLKTPQDFR